jgi:serine/threonine protein kinase
MAPGVEAFLAFDALLHRPVIVETPAGALAGRQSADWLFVGRRQVGAALHHRNIVAMLDLGEDHGVPYAVSECFAGETLRTIIQTEAPFDVDDVAILIEQLTAGLQHAHSRGTVHGDLSPGSVIVDATGLAKIAGFGVIEGQLLHESGSRAPVDPSPYLPPDLRGNSLITPGLDVHGLAAIAFEMLVGVPPDADQGFRSPSSLYPTVPARAGETVLQGLLAFEQRTGLTAAQFSHALTNWRSWAAQSTPGPSRESIAPARERRPTTQHQARLPPAATWPGEYSHSSDPLASQVVGSPMSRGLRFARWAALLAVPAALLVLALLLDPVASDAVSAVIDLPAEIQQLLNATSGPRE